MRRYFITGGTGFIGREIVRQLLAREDTEQVTCLTRGRRLGVDILHHDKLDYWLGDIVNCDFPNSPYTDLIHGANEANDLLQPDQLDYYYTIVEGTSRVMDWAANKQRGINILHLSSGAVVKGDSIYCKAKRVSEKINKLGTIARIFSVLGEEMPLNGQYAAGRFIGMALQGKITYYSAGFIRSYLHVWDCAAIALHTLDNSHPGASYDIGSSEAISVSDLARKIGRVFQVPCKRTEDSPDHLTAQVYLPDPIRMPSKLPTMNLDQSLRRLYAHFCNTDV